MNWVLILLCVMHNVMVHLERYQLPNYPDSARKNRPSTSLNKLVPTVSRLY